MRSRPERFEENAIRCEELAVLTARVELRTLYLDLAWQWRDMAATVRELERLRSAAGPDRHEAPPIV